MNVDYRPHLFPHCEAWAAAIRRLFTRQTCPDCPHTRKATP